MEAFIIVPIIFAIILFVVVTIIVISILKAASHKNLFANMDDQFNELRENATKLTNSVFNPEFTSNIFKTEKFVTCEYCGSELPEKTTKCPNCSANVKRNK